MHACSNSTIAHIWQGRKSQSSSTASSASSCQQVHPAARQIAKLRLAEKEYRRGARCKRNVRQQCNYRRAVAWQFARTIVRKQGESLPASRCTPRIGPIFTMFPRTIFNRRLPKSILDNTAYNCTVHSSREFFLVGFENELLPSASRPAVWPSGADLWLGCDECPVPRALVGDHACLKYGEVLLPLCHSSTALHRASCTKNPAARHQPSRGGCAWHREVTGAGARPFIVVL